MEMSQAALPPRQPHISAQDRAHPWFPIYAQYRASMNANLVEASSFEDWKFQRDRSIRDGEIAKHPRFAEFKAWMTTNQGGARKCPAGLFPNNFLYWIEGGRW